MTNLGDTSAQALKKHSQQSLGSSSNDYLTIIMMMVLTADT
jgi:hypothetical protein